MARIRTLKPEFWADEKLAPLRPVDRLVFLGLISQADDAGRLVDSVRLIDGLLFSQTDDSCAESLETLSELGLIDRGVTLSGQAVIQVLGWTKHQKIEKPNLRGALPQISIASATRRRNVPERLRNAIWERDEGKCQTCGRECRRLKRDKYDFDDDLGQIGHVNAVANGGCNDPENLYLQCHKCNHQQRGKDDKERNSAKSRGNVGEESPNHTLDLRPTTTDQTTDTLSNESDAKTAAPSVDNPLEDVNDWLAYFMPIARANGFEADRTDGSILKAMHKKKYPAADVEAAIRGTARMKAAGKLSAWRDRKLSMELLYARPKPDAPPDRRPLWNKAVELYHAELERSSRSDPNAGNAIGEVLRRMQTGAA